MSIITAAFIGTLVYWIIYIIDPFLLSWQCFNRPIIVAPIIGLALGDFQTGIIMGASLESIFMGISAIGGSVPADGLSAAIIAVTYTVVTGSDIETGLAIALPIGTLMASFAGMLTPFFASVAPYWEKLATSGKPKQFLVQNLLFTSIAMPLPNVIVLFVGLAYGVEGLNNLLGVMPQFVLTGLGAASAMMVAVGFAILMSMIWSASVGSFFFVGYVLAKIVGLDSLSIAIIGFAIAITMFFNSKYINDIKNSISAAGNNGADAEEEFF